MSTEVNALNEKIEALITQCRELNFEKKKEAVTPIREAIELAEKSNQPALLVKSLVWYATVLCDTYSNYPEAIRIADKANSLATELNDNNLLLRVYSALGMCYHYSGNLQVSHNYYLMAIALAEERSKTDTNELEGLGNLYYNMAVLFKTEEFSKLRIKYLQNAIDIYHQTGYQLGLSRCYNAYSSYHAHLKEYDKAIEYQKKALKISENIGDRHGISIYNNNIGSMYIDTREYELGMKYLTLALEQKIEIGNKHSIAVSHLHIGLAHMEMGDIDQAIKSFLRAELILNEIHSKIFLKEIYEHLSSAYAQKEDYKHAYEFQKKHSELKDELSNFDKTTAIFEAQAKAEMEKTEKEAVLLRQKNAEIQEYAQRLESSNNELKQFAHVASHDLREPLRMINSYISLVERKASEKLNEEEKQFIQFAVEGAKRMDSLISDLLTLSKVSSTAQNDLVDLNMIFGEVMSNLSDAVKQSGAAVSTDKLPLIKADKTQMTQLFQNLISNAIKYNKSTTPEVTLAYREENGHHLITVADNGIGIPPEHRERVFVIFQRLHNRNEYSGTGIGLSICRKIVEQMNGTIAVEENPTGGSAFIIQIPVK